MKTNQLALATAAIMAAVPLTSAQAEIVTARFTATITSGHAALLSATVEGEATYDSEATPLQTGGTFVVYPVISYTAWIDGIPLVLPESRLIVMDDRSVPNGTLEDQVQLQRISFANPSGAGLLRLGLVPPLAVALAPLAVAGRH